MENESICSLFISSQFVDVIASVEFPQCKISVKNFSIQVIFGILIFFLYELNHGKTRKQVDVNATNAQFRMNE